MGFSGGKKGTEQESLRPRRGNELRKKKLWRHSSECVTPASDDPEIQSGGKPRSPGVCQPGKKKPTQTTIVRNWAKGKGGRVNHLFLRVFLKTIKVAVGEISTILKRAGTTQSQELKKTRRTASRGAKNSTFHVSSLWGGYHEPETIRRRESAWGAGRFFLYPCPIRFNSNAFSLVSAERGAEEDPKIRRLQKKRSRGCQKSRRPN